MSGLLDSVMRGVASNLISTFGTVGKIITYAATSYDPVTDTTTGGVESETTVICSPPMAYKNAEVDGKRILVSDLRVMVPFASYETQPSTDQRFEIAGNEYAIISVMPIYSGNYAAVWELQIRV